MTTDVNNGCNAQGTDSDLSDRKACNSIIELRKLAGHERVGSQTPALLFEAMDEETCRNHDLSLNMDTEALEDQDSLDLSKQF